VFVEEGDGTTSRRLGVVLVDVFAGCQVRTAPMSCTYGRGRLAGRADALRVRKL